MLSKLGDPIRTLAGYSLLLLWCIGSTGCCRLLNLAYRTTSYEPALYCPASDETYSLDLYSHWADEAWSREVGGCGDSIALPDYSLGFHAGFVDYCYAGGTGEPPPVPPRIYWNVSWRLSDGKASVRAWFEGYRHGARVARDGGYRESAVVQSSTGVLNSRAGYHREQAIPNEEYGSSEGGQHIEAIPTPETGPRNDDSDRVRPTEPPQTPLPELTRPKTGIPPDGAAMQRRDNRFRPASCTVAAAAHKRAARDAGAPMISSNGQPTNRNDSSRSAHTTRTDQTPPTERLTGDISAVEATPPCIAAPTEGCETASVTSDGALPAIKVQRLQAGGAEEATSGAAAPQQDSRTTLVFKHKP
jgi:hypothetical protein